MTFDLFDTVEADMIDLYWLWPYWPLTFLIQWEQKYLEENMRQLALQNPELQDQYTFDVEKLQLAPKVEKMGPVEEVFRSQITELESK